MDRFEKSCIRQMTLQEELEVLSGDPTAQELLELLKDQRPERTDQLMTTLTTLAEQEEDYAPEDE